jgi:hypothetical protein
VIEIPEVVTHRYDPSRGACLNLCSLSDFEASDELDRLRRGPRPTLKNNYLIRRRLTEEWLAVAAREVLGRAVGQPPEPPVYFFLGDFSYMADPSRPAALVIPLRACRPRFIEVQVWNKSAILLSGFQERTAITVIRRPEVGPSLR